MIIIGFSLFHGSRQMGSDERSGRKAALFCRPLGRHLSRAA